MAKSEKEVKKLEWRKLKMKISQVEKKKKTVNFYENWYNEIKSL